jgi:Cof subfamily protein (haloacid dehalogenase superfamily)
MKILASDYDGTLNVTGEVSQENKDAIAAWRAAGNLFGLVSGRNLGSIKKFLDRDNVPYDFMVGCNGAVITDAEGNATGHNCIPAHIAKAIFTEIHRYEAYYVSASYDWGSVGVQASSDLRADDTCLMIDEMRLDRVLQVSCWFTCPEHALAVREKCEAMFPGQIKGLMPTVQSIDFVCAGTDKASGIRKLSTCRGLAPEVILTVGDGENDLSMLEAPDFYGHAMQSAMPVVLDRVERTTKSVAALIEEYL